MEIKIFKTAKVVLSEQFFTQTLAYLDGNALLSKIAADLRLINDLSSDSNVPTLQGDWENILKAEKKLNSILSKFKEIDGNSNANCIFKFNDGSDNEIIIVNNVDSNENVVDVVSENERENTNNFSEKIKCIGIQNDEKYSIIKDKSDQNKSSPISDECNSFPSPEKLILNTSANQESVNCITNTAPINQSRFVYPAENSIFQKNVNPSRKIQSLAHPVAFVQNTVLNSAENEMGHKNTNQSGVIQSSTNSTSNDIENFFNSTEQYVKRSIHDHKLSCHPQLNNEAIGSNIKIKSPLIANNVQEKDNKKNNKTRISSCIVNYKEVNESGQIKLINSNKRLVKPTNLFTRTKVKNSNNSKLIIDKLALKRVLNKKYIPSGLPNVYVLSTDGICKSSDKDSEKGGNVVDSNATFTQITENMAVDSVQRHFQTITLVAEENSRNNGLKTNKSMSNNVDKDIETSNNILENSANILKSTKKHYLMDQKKNHGTLTNEELDGLDIPNKSDQSSVFLSRTCSVSNIDGNRLNFTDTFSTNKSADKNFINDPVTENIVDLVEETIGENDTNDELYMNIILSCRNEASLNKIEVIKKKGYVAEKDKENPLDKLCQLLRIDEESNFDISEKKLKAYERKNNYEQNMPYKYFCSKCSYKTKRKNQFCKHLKLHEKNKVLHHCHVCKFSTMRLPTLRRHEITHNTSQIVKCPFCPYITDSLTLLKRHNYIRHSAKNSNLKCTKCDFTACTPRQMRKHRHLHDLESEIPKKLWKCELCSYKTVNKGHLKRHENDIHNPHRSYLCDYCGKSFKRYDTLKQHKILHGEIGKAYSCPQCSKACRSVANLKEHMTVHTTLRPYLCEVCGTSFKTQANHTKHVKTSQCKAKFVPCTICNRVFINDVLMKRHQFMHCSNKSNTTDKQPDSAIINNPD